ncbi:hypothetical protein PHYBOEH_006446 [Phytophthora boehmeriae]|uniref:RxLR effector protein n=1 Tax=Phytophthora boehmeriae TaxID=109152 RepID=A0A8T1WGB2_9STRA|nr:hypothetical protein PHYBOEH_006446 [Phytophthora boehmeriae]
MRLHYFFLVAVIVLLSATASADPNQAEIAKVGNLPRLLAAAHGADNKNKLRRVEVTTGEDNEERAISIGGLGKALNKATSKIKNSKAVSKVRYEIWLKKGETPKTMFKKLGMSGLTPAQQSSHPNFKHYLAFSALWRKKKGLGGR